MRKLTISDNISTLSLNSFMDCVKLESIIFGDNLSSMNNGAGIFNRCTSLKKDSFSISNNNTSFKIVDGVLYSNDLTKIILFPPGEEGELKIPNFVKIFGNYSFYSSRLTSIYIPESITTWGSQVFNESKIENINIRCNVFGGLCFRLAPIKNVIIGKNVSLIKANALIDHLDVQYIKYEGSMEEWNSITKESGWNNRCTNLTTIQCTDGIITL